MQTKVHLTFFLVAITLSLFLGGCSGLRPIRSATSPESVNYFVAPTKIATPTPELQLTSTSAVDAQPNDCTNVLSYLSDLSIPDGTFIDASSSLDKKWQVRNSGTCNWNESYTLQMTSGDLLGATSPQALAPARSGTETVIRIIFTAPQNPGNYSSTWQAFTADGQPFGDPLFIEINVPAK
ncbi:MAG: NBR1-Ig-like domain-containing protein [Anaerolineaceae bacterium]